MKELQATVDLEFIKEVMQKTHRRIDTHAFHTIIWGCIVLVWYPLGNYFVQQEMMAAYFALIPICLVLGSVLSGVSEYRRSMERAIAWLPPCKENPHLQARGRTGGGRVALSRVWTRNGIQVFGLSNLPRERC